MQLLKGLFSHTGNPTTHGKIDTTEITVGQVTTTNNLHNDSDNNSDIQGVLSNNGNVKQYSTENKIPNKNSITPDSFITNSQDNTDNDVTNDSVSDTSEPTDKKVYLVTDDKKSTFVSEIVTTTPLHLEKNITEYVNNSPVNATSLIGDVAESGEKDSEIPKDKVKMSHSKAGKVGSLKSGLFICDNETYYICVTIYIL